MRPSRLSAIEVIGPVWPWKVRRHRPLQSSQTATLGLDAVPPSAVTTCLSGPSADGPLSRSDGILTVPIVRALSAVHRTGMPDGLGDRVPVLALRDITRPASASTVIATNLSTE